MALITLTQSSSGNTFTLDESEITKAYNKNSQIVIEYIEQEVGIRKSMGVDESLADIKTLANNIINTTIDGVDVYLNSNRVVSTTSISSLGVIDYDNGGDIPEKLKLDVTESAFLALYSNTSTTTKSYSQVLTQAEVRTLNSSNGGFGYQLLPNQGVTSVVQVINPTITFKATGGTYATADLWIYDSVSNSADYKGSTNSALGTPSTLLEQLNVEVAAFLEPNSITYLYSTVEQSAFEGTWEVKFDYKVIDIS